MKPSISSLYFSDLSPSEMVRLFARHGWQCLELSESHAADLVARGNPESAGRALRDLASDNGIEFCQGHLPVLRRGSGSDGQDDPVWFDIAPASDTEFERALEVSNRWLDLLAAMQIPLAVAHIGGARLKTAGWSNEAVFSRRVEALSTVAAYAAEAGITLCVENLSYPDCGAESPDELRAYIAAVADGKVGICLDTGHAHLAGLDCVTFIRAAADMLKTVHLHENAGVNDDHALPYELGTIPWKRVLTALVQIGYTGPLSLEVVPRPWQPMPVREAALDYAGAILAHMLRSAEE